MKILSVVGARPQFIKAAMVSRALRPRCQEILVHTGQHYDGNMSQVFFDELELPEPDIYLGVGSGSHAAQTGRMMVGIEEILLRDRPDWIVVYGDTNTTLAGGLAAAKLQVPVAHVEAGLRSYQRAMPEEINRVLVDHISEVLFCPTQQSVDNLAKEGVTKGIHVVGDVMADALQHFIRLAPQKTTILTDLDLKPGQYALATVHRAANTDDPTRLKAILKAFDELNLPVVFPVHPRTRKVIHDLGLTVNRNVNMIEPVGYLAMLQLEANAGCILTDSGGVQKEAYWAGVRCITLRDETEWVETVELGWNRLVGADSAAIVDAVQNWYPSSERAPVYGDGKSAEKISGILLQKS
jgi:UDP-GlcNAc3NAcA epimerase